MFLQTYSQVFLHGRVYPSYSMSRRLLTLHTPASNICEQTLTTIQNVCASLVMPLALAKVYRRSFHNPCIFLGITLDSINMEVRLPAEKLTRIRQLITSLLKRKKATTKHEILSLVGLLQYAARAICCGRIFISWVYSTAAKVKARA